MMRAPSGAATRLLSLVVVAAAALAGCSSDEAESESPEFPTGSYNVLATPTQVITFREDGTYTVTYPDRVLSEGSYTIDGDTYTGVSDSFCASRGATEPARYTWSWDGEMLTMTLQGEDACEARAEAQAGGMTPVPTPAAS